MRKFKLTEEYPGSPKLNTICNYTGDLFDKDNDLLPSIVNNKNFLHFWEEIIEYPIGTRVFNSTTNCIYTKKEDGWYKPGEKTAYTDAQLIKSKCINIISEEIVEKEYEILSIYTPRTEEILTDSNIETWETNISSRGEWVIHSVKRLSDGEIFTINDKITYPYNYSETGIVIKEYIIEKIYFIETPKLAFYVGGGLSLGIKSISKSKQPLFRTEDGVDIFEGDKIYYICDGLELRYVKKVNINMWNLIEEANNGNFKTFTTKSLALEYKLLNSPCLTINDILSRYNSKWSQINEFTLKALAKSKL